ncbi:MAG TPA: MCE family protein [Rhodospirillales bacterium]|nr:MCE family protein [Rhodospirillales bacterium]
MGRNAIETVMGAVVLIMAAMFVYFAYTTADIKSVQGYQVSAAFYKIGGLGKGSDVRINGIKVGTVSQQILDSETFDAIVKMTIKADIRLPDDTVAAIASEGILGGMYVRLIPGTSKSYLPEGGKITKIKDFTSLEDQVGKIIFLATGSNEN